MAEFPLSSAALRRRAEEITQNRPGAAAKDFHFVYKAADAVLTVPLRNKKPKAGHAFRAFVQPSSANYERVAAFVQVFESLLPGVASRLSRSLLKPQALPLVYDELSLLGYGSGATAFLIQQGQDRLVLKVYRRSLGRPFPKLEEITQHFAEKYRTVSQWYQGPLNMVPPATFLMLHGPLLSCRAAGVLQPYIPGEKRDLFTDFTAGEFLALLRANPNLCRQFRFFAQRTLEVYEQQGRCVDFIGHANAMLSKAADGEWQLQVVDNGIFDLSELKEKTPETYALVLAYLEQLQSLYEESLTFADTGGQDH